MIRHMMTDKHQAKWGLLSKDEIKNQILDLLSNQIAQRRNMMNQMVGTLYPSILHDEIDYLQTLISNVKAT